MGCEDVQERLEGIGEDDLVILPRVDRSQLYRLFDRGRDRTLTLGPGMKFEMVVERYLFLARLLDESYPDIDFELSPSGFRNLERWLVNIWMIASGYLHSTIKVKRERLSPSLTSNGILVCVVKFERYAFDEIPQVVGTSDDIRVWVGGRATYGNGPPVGMGLRSRLSLLRGEDAGCVPVDNRTIDA